MTLQELKERKDKIKEKEKQIDNFNEEELLELKKEIEEIQNLEKEETNKEKEENKITKEEERKLLRNTINDLELRNENIETAKEIKKENKEERKVKEKEKELLEQRGADLKEGKRIIIKPEERAMTVSGGTVLVQKKYKNSISETFEEVSGIVDKLNSIPMNGGESYTVPFEKTYGEGDYTNEIGEYSDTEVETDYVETGRAKITAYTEITKEAIKLPNTNYQELVIKRVRDAIRKKIGAQVIVGNGGANQIKGIYNADTKVMSGTSDVELATINADTLNTIVFAYGGEESVEGIQELILSKVDLEEFAKVKTTDGKFVYNITRNGQTGTIEYKDGGLSVPYTINSACNALSKAKTGDFTMIYGSLQSYELPVFSELEIQESKDYKFKQGMICYAGDVIVGGTVSKYNGFVRVKKSTESV